MCVEEVRFALLIGLDEVSAELGRLSLSLVALHQWVCAFTGKCAMRFRLFPPFPSFSLQLVGTGASGKEQHSLLSLALIPSTRITLALQLDHQTLYRTVPHFCQGAGS